MDKFILHSNYKPTGDQPQAIEQLVDGIKRGDKEQVLLGVTGSGKTFTMANIIEQVNRPTLVLAHNKTLAAQLCSEFKEFFPENAVEYFVSYYDYFQPEAYIPGKDIYIEKDSAINEDIDKMRHSATSALFERRDVIIVSSVSCIYSLGDPAEYENLVISLRPGMLISREELIKKLVSIQFERNDIDFTRNRFRVKGDVVEIYPASSTDSAIRVELFGDEIDRISEINVVTGQITAILTHVALYPATHYVTTAEKRLNAIKEIKEELAERIQFFRDRNMLIEAQRIEERVRFDIEMIEEVGYCSGIENYSRVFAGKAPGSTPYTLLDYFPKDFLLFIDESHVTIPQVRGMSGGDSARKKNLVEYGFRLPSAYDNRPLFFDEFTSKLNQIVYVSATPDQYELERSSQVVEQIIRPTGLLDPTVEVRPVEGQIDDLIGEINQRVEKGQRALVVTLTKKMAEDLTSFLCSAGIKAKYMHHNVETIDRIELIKELRQGKYDVLVGINLLREGLDLPEVSLVAILDADKEGFLRSVTSFVQIIGRAARHIDGHVIMYADTVTKSMKKAIDETSRRRLIQDNFNKEHGIIPHTIKKEISDNIDVAIRTPEAIGVLNENKSIMSAKERKLLIDKLTREMTAASRALDFEYAAILRDKIFKLKENK
ncbi:MAG: excinuclease ABC subunit UvrB [Ruminococcaceae bacterium]|nr:excinuclease ABC subunit UvrB [Oscillospiraceae bacterium]